MASQVHETATTPGEAEDLFAGWTEDSPNVSNPILGKKAASKSPVLVAWASHHLPAEQSLPGGPGHGAGRLGPPGGSEACSAAWLRAQCPQSGAATPHRSPAPSHGGERTGATDPASHRVSVPAPGNWALLSSLKTPSYLTLQVHSLNAVPTPGLCPASTRLWMGTCCRKLPLIVSREAVLPGSMRGMSIDRILHRCISCLQLPLVMAEKFGQGRVTQPDESPRLHHCEHPTSCLVCH